MVQIFTQLIATFHDFGGILLGNCKLSQEKISNQIYNSTKSLINLNKSKDTIITEIIIDNITVVYNLLDSTSIQTVIQSIHKSYPDKVIIGMFSAKSFSYPTISLKEQELHLFLRKYLRNELKGIYLSIPLLFALFIHSKQSDDPIKQSIQFSSKVYLYEDIKQEFKAVKFDMTNMKFDNYFDIINPIANKTLSFVLNTGSNERKKNIMVNGFEEEIAQLKIEIEKMLIEITYKKLLQIQKIKKKLQRYLDYHFRLLKLLKSLNTD